MEFDKIHLKEAIVTWPDIALTEFGVKNGFEIC